MFYNNAVCDIYIGKSAGAKMMQDIRNAQRNVKIVSPYLSPFLIKELIHLHSRADLSPPMKLKTFMDMTKIFISLSFNINVLMKRQNRQEIIL